MLYELLVQAPAMAPNGIHLSFLSFLLVQLRYVSQAQIVNSAWYLHAQQCIYSMSNKRGGRCKQAIAKPIIQPVATQLKCVTTSAQKNEFCSAFAGQACVLGGCSTLALPAWIDCNAGWSPQFCGDAFST